jgi:K+-sensing histidine kinase KdpD
LSNAASYGGPDISISIDTEGATVRISVGDNGNGVPASQAEHIFEPYHRVHAPSSTSGTLGLGLSVSRTLARYMAGDLVYYRVGGVTTFELQLPAVESLGLPDRTQPSPIPQRVVEEKQDAGTRPHGPGSRASQDRRREPAQGTSS